MTGKIVIFYTTISASNLSVTENCGTDLENERVYRDGGSLATLGGVKFQPDPVGTYCGNHPGQTVTVTNGQDVVTHLKFINTPELSQPFEFDWYFGGLNGWVVVTL